MVKPEAEVTFLRLLHAAEKRIGGGETFPQEYITSLASLFTQLTNPDPAYQRRLTALTDLHAASTLVSGPQVVSPPRGSPVVASTPSPTPASGTEVADDGRLASPAGVVDVEPSPSPPPLPPPQPRRRLVKRDGGKEPVMGDVHAARDANARMKRDMEAMAQALKTHSMRLNSALRKDNEALDDIAGAAEANVNSIGQVVDEVQRRSASSWSNCLSVCVMLCLVILFFAITFVVIQAVPKRVVVPPTPPPEPSPP